MERNTAERVGRVGEAPCGRGGGGGHCGPGSRSPSSAPSSMPRWRQGSSGSRAASSSSTCRWPGPRSSPSSPPGCGALLYLWRRDPDQDRAAAAAVELGSSSASSPPRRARCGRASCGARGGTGIRARPRSPSCSSSTPPTSCCAAPRGSRDARAPVRRLRRARPGRGAVLLLRAAAHGDVHAAPRRGDQHAGEGRGGEPYAAGATGQLAGFTVLFFWMHRVRLRLLRLAARREPATTSRGGAGMIAAAASAS